MNIISNKKNLMFVLLFILIAILSIRSTVTGPKQIHVPLKYKPRDKNAASKDAKYENLNIPELKLNELNKPKIKYQKNTKNIFKSIIIPPVKHTPPSPVVKPRPAPPSIPKRNPLEDELKKFQFIGFIEKKGETSIFLSKGDNLFVVSKGEKIEYRFLVKDITQTNIILTIINQTDIEFKLSLKEDRGISRPGNQGASPISYPKTYKPQVPDQPVPKPGQRRPPMQRLPPKSEF